MAAIGRSHPKAKESELHYAALTEATRAYCDPLSAASDLPTIQLACQALGRALGGLADSLQMSAAAKTQCTALQGMLAYPSPQLKEAFKTHLRAEAAQAGGGLVEVAVEAELAARRVSIASALIKPADAPAHVKQKDLFRRIRDEHSFAWVASCGSLLEKANAALDTLTADGRATTQMPPNVVDKWQVALFAAHREGCKFKPRSQCSPPIKGLHLYCFELAGAPLAQPLCLQRSQPNQPNQPNRFQSHKQSQLGKVLRFPSQTQLPSQPTPSL